MKTKNKKTSYLGNSKIKKDGVEISWTKEQIQEYKKCSEDPIYFIENYTKIINVDEGLIPFNMYDYQKDMVKVLHESSRAIIRCSRQIGKCVDKDTIIRLRYKKKHIIEIEIGKFYEYVRNSNEETNTLETQL